VQVAATTELTQLRAARKQEVERFGSAQESLALADEALAAERVRGQSRSLCTRKSMWCHRACTLRALWPSCLCLNVCVCVCVCLARSSLRRGVIVHTMFRSTSVDTGAIVNRRV
jgi:hypothetical protein